jgi:hypothetical protein
MAKKRAAVKTESAPALFSPEQYSSGIGDIERSPKDPYWDEIVLDSEITQVEATGQTTLFYDATTEPPTPEQFNSIEAYSAAYDSWCVNHPELVNHGFTDELDRLIPANAKTGVFIVEKTDASLNLGIISNTNELGFFVDWLNFGESTEDINFLCGTNCFNNWERDQWAIEKLAIAPDSLVDKFLEVNPSFSLKNEYEEFKVGDKIIIPDNWEDKGGLWDTYPQYWINNHEACFYDGENIFTKNKHKVISNEIKQKYLSPRWYLSCLDLEKGKKGKSNKESLSLEENLKVGDKVKILSHKEKYFCDDNWGILGHINKAGKLDVKMADRFWIAVDFEDILGIDSTETDTKTLITEYPKKPLIKVKKGEIYLHSSGKKVKIEKILKSKLLKGKPTGYVEVYFEGEIDKQEIAIADLSYVNADLTEIDHDQLVRENLQIGDKLGFTIGDRLFSQQLQRTGEVVKVGKSGFSIEWQGWVKVPYSFSQIEELQLSKLEESTSCLPCSTVTPEQEQPPLRVINSESEQPSLLKSTTAPNESLNIDFQISQFTTTSEPIKDNSNGITSTGSASPAPEQATPENGKDLITQNQKCGFTLSERSQLNSLISLLLNNPEELSTTDLEQFLEDSEWSNITGKIPKSYQQRNLERPTKESEFSLLPTPTTYPKGSGKCRPAGANRLEQKLRPFINKGDKLHPAVPGWMMGFPIGWVEYPLADTGEILSVQVPLIPAQGITSTTAATALISTVEQSHPNKQKLSSNESVTLQNSQELTTTNADNQTTTTKIKAITLHQPWASLVGKHKHYETRGKATYYRGKIAIHAAVRQEMTDYQVDELSDLLVGENIPFGVVVAIADLTDCIRMSQKFIDQQSETELRCGLWEVGRYAWKLENVVFLPEPIPARGMPGLWDIELELPEGSRQEAEGRRQEAEGRRQDLKPTFKSGDYILNGRVGQIIEDSPGQYFTVQYSKNDLKCYFWGQDDDFINQLVFAPPDLIEEFVRENKETPREEAKTKKSKTASGSLAPFLENKKLKDGRIVTYPRVHGERDKLNYDHWRWGYYYEIKIGDEWKNRSMPVPARIASLVREMIDKKYSVEQIKDFILQSKTNKHKPE